MLTTDAVKLFITAKQSGNRSVHTLKWYRIILTQYAAMFPQLPKSPEALEKFIASCHGGDERKHGYYRALKVFYRWLKKRKIMRKNPLDDGIDTPQLRHKERPFLMPAKLNQLLNYPHPPEIKAALLFMADTGARLSEVHNLTVDNLSDLGDSWEATINGKTGERIVPISYESYHAMIVTLPYKYSVDWLCRAISEAFKNAGVRGTGHTLRHTFGTLWEGDESVLQHIMGHATITTTQIYRHSRMKFIHEQHAKYSPLRCVLNRTNPML